MPINIIYIDDGIDDDLSEYLFKFCAKHESNYSELVFTENMSYEDLLNTKVVINSNIIIIDSTLFTNDKVAAGKFTGEEFRIILKKIMPYIEVIVISQNDDGSEYGVISKCRSRDNENAIEYYNMELKPLLENSIKEVETYLKLANKLDENKTVDRVLIEKVISSISGTYEYDELKKEDIDNIIVLFKEIEAKLNV